MRIIFMKIIRKKKKNVFCSLHKKYDVLDYRDDKKNDVIFYYYYETNIISYIDKYHRYNKIISLTRKRVEKREIFSNHFDVHT